MTTVKKENSAIIAFKVWVFPSLVSLLGIMIWSDVNEVKADVKALMAQSNIDKTRIDNLERQLYKPSTTNNPLIPVKDEQPRANQYAILIKPKLSKHDF
jgi:hypothetical protein